MANITNYLNKIKTAVYGKEVRGAIHDAIKECYDDASVNHDNANMEVKMARGTHNTLNDRLDKSEQKLDETNAQLSAKIQEVASTGTTTEVLKSTTENYIQEKLDDGTIANLTIENGSVTRNKLAFPLLSHLSVSNKDFVIETIGNNKIIVKFQPTTMWLTDNNFKTIKAIDIEECQFVINTYGMLGWDLKSNTINIYPYNYEVTHSNIYPLVFFDSYGIITGDLIDIFNNKQINDNFVNLTNKINDGENMVAYAPVGSKMEIHYDSSSKKVYYYCADLRVKTRNFDKYYSFDNIKELFPQQIELYNGKEYLAINDGDCLTFNDKTGSLEITGWLEEVSTHHFRLIYNLAPNNLHGYLISYYYSHSINSINQSINQLINDRENMVAYAPVGSKMEIHYDSSSKKVYYYCTNLRVKTKKFSKYYSFDNIKELFPEQIEEYKDKEFLAINDGDCLTFNDETGNLEMTGWLEEVSAHHFRLIYNLAPNNLHGYLISYYYSHSINSVNQSINSINQSITDLKKGLNESTVLIPTYFVDYINTKIKAINLDLEKAGGDGFAINVVGDMHYQRNSKNTHSLIKYMSPQINAKLTIALGDYINNDKDLNNLRSEYLEILKNFESIDMIGCLGNHDDNSIYNQMNYVFNNRAMYNYINRKFEDSVIFGGDFYYYRDDIKNKIRYICLDTQDTGNPTDKGDGTIAQPRQYTRMVSQKQVEWFSNVALNVSDDWGVIVFAHHNLFSDGIVGTEGDVVNGEAIWNKLVQFKNDGGTVICWINGHVHYDNLIKRDGINIVTVLNNDMSVWSTAPKKIKGTTSELAFDVAVVNKLSRTAKLYRIGAGDDRQFSY